MKRWLAFTPLLGLLILVAAAAFLLARGGERETFSAGMLGRPAPEFALERLDSGSTFSSAELEGRAYVINLFASWCTPCRVEHPQLMALRQRGAEIIGVAYKDRPEASAAFLNELGDPFGTVVLDPEGRFGLELGIAGVPETFVVGADGRIAYVHRGPLTDEILQEEILPALGLR